MRGGRLDKVVQVQQMQRQRTGLGDSKPGEWSKVKDMYARLARSSVIERFVTAQVQAEMSAAFEMREWPGGVETANPATQRVFYRGKPYNLHGVTDMGRGAGVLVVCTTRGEPVAPADVPAQGA